MVHGSWFMDHGLWIMVNGSWLMNYSWWIIENGIFILFFLWQSNLNVHLEKNSWCKHGL